MASRLDSIYRASPVWVQNLGITLFGLMWRRRRFGPAFRAAVPEFAARERFSAAEWDAFQTVELRTMLGWCFERVPYYRRTWEKLGLTAAELAQFRIADLPRLPMISKQDILAAPADFLATPVEKKLHTYKTSGSTGTPLEIQMSADTQQRWAAAYEVRCRRWAGVDHTMSRAMIGGRLVVPEGTSAPPFWRYNAAERQLYFSAFHISPQNVPHYVGALNHYKPDYLVGYASGHFFLARMIEEAGLTVHQPKAILTSSEKLTSEMRATLSRVYGCKVFDGYSGVEPCCLASECEHGRLHVSPDVGVVELVDDHGQPVAAGEQGNVIATGLFCFDQPLVRYRMSDLAIAATEPCPCGRHMPVWRELVGRLEDTVIGPDGREMVRFHGILLGIPGIVEGQVIQEEIDRFTVRVASRTELRPEDLALIRSRFAERLGPVRVEIVRVDAIERTSRGKFRAVISRVPRSARRTTV